MQTRRKSGVRSARGNSLRGASIPRGSACKQALGAHATVIETIIYTLAADSQGLAGPQSIWRSVQLLVEGYGNWVGVRQNLNVVTELRSWAPDITPTVHCAILAVCRMRKYDIS